MTRKWVLAAVVIALLIGGCRAEPEIVDNGSPGQIQVTVYLDANRNGYFDEGEQGLAEKVGIGQDISCPVDNSDQVTVASTGEDGKVVFRDLEPGEYCVGYMGSRGLITRGAQLTYVSSDQVAMVSFGLTD